MAEMHEPLTDGGKEKAFSWLYKLAGKNTRAKDDISPALRAHTEETKREVGSEGRSQRSRSMSVASAERKDTRRKSLADVFTSRPNEEAKLTKAEEEKAAAAAAAAAKIAKKEAEKKPQTDADRALAKAKKAEEQALLARNEATRLIAEANKAIAAAAKATADAAQKMDVTIPEVTSAETSRSSLTASQSDRGTTELELSTNSAREDSEKAVEFRSSSTLCIGGQATEDSESPRESSSRGNVFSFPPKKSGSLAVEDDHNSTKNTHLLAAAAIKIEREAKIRNEYALVAERAAKKAIKQATKAKHEAEVAATKAADLESKQQAKEAKRRGRSPKAYKHDLQVHSEHDSESSNRKSTSANELERMPSSSSLSSIAPTLTLNEVLASEEGVAAFKQFAAEGFVLENISFVLEVRAFDLLEDTAGSEEWLKRAHEIFNTYVQVGSVQEVNVTSKIRKDVVEKFEASTIEPGVFKGLAAEALRILRTNDWPQFLKSEHYRKLESTAS